MIILSSDSLELTVLKLARFRVFTCLEALYVYGSQK